MIFNHSAGLNIFFGDTTHLGLRFALYFSTGIRLVQFDTAGLVKGERLVESRRCQSSSSKKHPNRMVLYLDFDLYAKPERQLKATDLSGQGQAGIFIVYDPGVNAADNLAYLKKILAAAKIDLDNDTYCLALSKEEQLQLDKRQFAHEIKHVLLFGVQPKQLSLNFILPPYQVKLYQKETYLIVDALELIQEERQAGNNKKAGALWLALKQIFLS